MHPDVLLHTNREKGCHNCLFLSHGVSLTHFQETVIYPAIHSLSTVQIEKCSKDDDGRDENEHGVLEVKIALASELERDMNHTRKERSEKDTRRKVFTKNDAKLFTTDGTLVGFKN